MNGAAAPRAPVKGLMSTMSRAALSVKVVPTAKPFMIPRFAPLIPTNRLVTPFTVWFVNSVIESPPGSVFSTRPNVARFASVMAVV